MYRTLNLIRWEKGKPLTIFNQKSATPVMNGQKGAQRAFTDPGFESKLRDFIQSLWMPSQASRRTSPELQSQALCP